MFYSSSVEMPWLMPAMMVCPTMKFLLKLTSMQCGLPSFATTEHPTKLPKDYKTFYERPRNQPIWNSTILRHDSTSLKSTCLFSQDSMVIASMMPTCSTPFKNVFADWNNSYIASNTTTKNINDLLEYYGKLEQQEAKRKPKCHYQDNNKLQPARNQNQCCQGNQNQCNENNCHNKESFCS